MNTLRVQWLDDAAALQAHAEAMAALAAEAIEPNVFHEPWLLLPALQRFRPADVRAALIWREDDSLAALLPFQWHPRSGLRPAFLSLWRHPYCFLGTPLVHHVQPEATLAALLDSVEQGRAPAHCMQLDGITAEGAFSRALMAALRTRSRWRQHRDLRQRALLDLCAQRQTAPDLSARHLKDLRRKRRKLEQTGKLAIRRLADDEDLTPWLDEFLRLEASGWKGRVGTALDNSPADAAFFRRIAESAHQQRRLHLLALTLEGRAIAMQCDFFAGNGGFAFKVAYDETFAAASPGLQLELEAMPRLAATPTLAWIDSCATPDHRLMNRLWRGRRALADHWLAYGIGLPAFWLSLLRLRREVGARVRRWRAR